jgi:phosphinothricin acetyltransferase
MDARPGVIEVRDAEARDLARIAAIYAHHVLTGLASFETEAPDEAEIGRRFRDVREKGFPYLVAELGGEIAGYAYASAYRTRPAYRFSLEDSIYVEPRFAGRGVGRTLLGRLIAACEAIGCRQLIAVIGDSANEASIGLHAALGFERVGTFKSVGFKHGRWVDSVLMQRAIGAGGTIPP